VLEDEALREDIKTYASWPTIPQLYVNGEFFGGCDIVKEAFTTGDLHEKLETSAPDVGAAAPIAPALTIGEEAAEQLRNAASQAPAAHALRLAIDARFRARMLLAPEGPGDVIVETNGVTLRVDSLSAPRADGARIDLVQSERGAAFRVTLPNSPFAVRPMTVKELKQRRDAGDTFEIFDLRTPDERARASIPGSKPVDAEQVQRVESLPRDTMLVFHDHHGTHSERASEHFASLGFTNVYNVVGGIDAWSLEIDPSVPRY